MNRLIFETCVQTQRDPTLNEGYVVIMDNLPAHTIPAREKAIRDR